MTHIYTKQGVTYICIGVTLYQCSKILRYITFEWAYTKGVLRAMQSIYETKYSRMDQVKFAEDSL